MKFKFKFKGYLRETRRPVYSAVLILPFLAVYHTGTFFLQTTYINGADALIIRILSLLSVHSMFGSALVLGICFVIWQARARASWKIDPRMLLLYFLESVCFALLLVAVFGWMYTRFNLAAGTIKQSVSNVVLYCGAGIYEELVFRAFLLTLIIALFNLILHQKRTALISAAVLGALLFSTFHYIGPSGDAFAVGSFLQRALGGLYFSILYITRGFGVAAASHALYDIFVEILQA